MKDAVGMLCNIFNFYVIRNAHVYNCTYTQIRIILGALEIKLSRN